jgi:hypothetical protein
MACGIDIGTSKVLLHLSKFLFFTSLLKIQQLHLSLKSPFLLAQSLVLELLFL